MVEVAPLSELVLEKEAALRRWLAQQPKVVVAYSGGVDSAYLAKVAHGVLGDRALAVTGRSPSLLELELEEARALAEVIGIQHRIVDTHELDRPGYVENDVGRCYHCKTELFDVTALVAGELLGAVVVDGFNADDLSDYRPGHRAAAEHQVAHPLAEVGLQKAEIRALSKALGLPTWQKPQLACLSSRLPYGMTVTPERLSRVGAVEVALRGLGFFDLRARLVKDNEDLVRIELGEDELSRLMDPTVRSQVVAAGRAAGFRFVTVDLEGFRSGRLNEGLVQLKRRN
ncbi:MAG: ATP-dependent sacrificial sulfur transferase LarE [Deltaproteobacteria bacterium]|jgi:uncharacterized protein|nr:ATP-dependent sacrificial sulfur transferase LarE [Deltaproteobacteria bacterium]